MFPATNSLSLLAKTLLLAATLTVGLPAMALDHSHPALSKILQQHVKAGKVDYAALHSNQAPLNSYLDSLATVKKSEFQRWNKNQQMTFLTNLYNAATLKLIVDNYPVKSIKKIGGFFSNPWKQKVVRLFGDTVSLDNVEHDMLRKDYQEARLHFALVCAAKGCPPLRNEAYDASRFSAQLDAQGKIYLSNTSINRITDGGNGLYLSHIFDWFEEDFVKQSGSVVAFVKPYLPNANQLAENPKVQFTDYDWSLNGQ